MLLVGLTVLSIIYVIPTFTGMDLATTRFPFKQKINMGLDLQGGLYLVLGVDFNKAFQEIVDRQGSSLEGRLKEKNIGFTALKTIKDGFPPDDSRISLDFDPAKREELYALIKKEFWTLRLSDEKPGHFEFGLSREFRVEVRERTIGQSIEVIRNRIDEFGVSEPAISSQGTDRIVVELPGVKDVDRAKGLIGQTAKLEFKMVNDKAMDQGRAAKLVSDIEKENNLSYKEGERFSDYVGKINLLAKGKIPEDSVIAFQREAGNVRVPFLLFAKTDVTGEELQDASVQIDNETQAPQVGFSLNPKGATLFDKLSGENIGKRMAIVLDGIVHSAPVFQSRIPNGSGRITLGSARGRDDLMKEAKDLAIVLRAGALPAQLDFLEQRVVGPSLGQDSIRKGALASIVGSLAVLLFVILYYRVSGTIAAISLMLNVLFVLASLVGLEATLTLPGIAGIALTVGIAVDSNVVIYERIREELRAGKRPEGAVEAGFQKAFRTILDANVTNAAAAIVLLMYGTGPIKGFAVTMLIGIVTTLFTAVFVCRVFFDYYLKVLAERKAVTLSI